jgi:hypothetical protein
LKSPDNNDSTIQFTTFDEEVIRRFRESILKGEHWYMALLTAIKNWQSHEETYRGHRYCYLIDGEAFDWQLLAERLCETVDGMIPDDEKNALLLHSQHPLDITDEQFRSYVGVIRFRQYLNYYYGITVERALIMAVKDEIRKERQVAGYITDKDNSDEAFHRVYGEKEEVLLDLFRKAKRRRKLKSMSLGELKEFTYWLFKYRLKYNDKEKVASDTRKALNWVQQHGLPDRFLNGQLPITIEQSL